MQSPTVSRRSLLKGGSAALAGLSVWQVSGPAEAFPGRGDDDDAEDVPWSDQPSNEYPGSPTDEVLKWLDQPAPVPPPAMDVVGNLLEWESLDSRITPNAKFFTVKHYNQPVIDPTTYQLSVDGLVDHPLTLSLDDIKARRRHEREFTLECSGNTGLPFFIGGIGNARWAGARLTPILRGARVQAEGTEVRFMARDYVTFRERTVDGETLWTFTTVSHDLLKSAPAKVTRHDGKYTIIGVAWGAPIRRVEISIDGGSWLKAQLGGSAQLQPSKGYAWRFWTFDWNAPPAGDHMITSRAIDVDGNVQPAPDDPSIATKVTYWESNGQITRRVLIA